MKVAIVHDWLVGGGAERVVEELHKLYPDAPIYTSYSNDEWRQRLNNKVVTGWLQHLGFMRKFIPILRIWWFTHLDLSQYDLVISSSGNGEAHGVKTGPGTLHVNYCHAPTHFYWRHYDQYMKQPGFGFLNPLARLGLKLLIRPLRSWDYKAAQRADYIVANSTHIQSEIKQFYGRDSVVIHPPIDTERFTHTTSQNRTGFVTAGRQVPYKRFDIIVRACNDLKLPLTVIGRGPDHNRLVRLAGDTITFETTVTDTQMPEYFAQASAFLFAAYEDFGITPVEAMAAGTPVIAYKAGGALDYVVPGESGEFFGEQSVNSLKQVLQGFKAAAYDQDKVRKHAGAFNQEAFRASFSKLIGNLYKNKV